MAGIRDAIPASLRRPAEFSQFVQATERKQSKVGAAMGAVAGSKGLLARLPEESEDARLTGATRSLTRRLLALNVSGSRRMKDEQVLLPKAV